MFIQNTMEVINAFLERYVPHHSEEGDFTDISTYEGKVRFTFNNDYYIYVWMEEGELKIESEYGDNLYESLDLDEDTIYYIKHGKKRD